MAFASPNLPANLLKVLAKPVVSYRYQVLVETLLILSSLIIRNQQYSLALRIEGISDPPDTLLSRESQLLHIAVPRTVKRIRVRSSEQWPIGLQHTDTRQQLVLNRFTQLAEFSSECIMKFYRPWHTRSISSNTYIVKRISLLGVDSNVVGGAGDFYWVAFGEAALLAMTL
jgi:hypothetical protein